MRFDVHNHSEYSNIRLFDCTNKPEALINEAIQDGLAGIALTDHDALCGHVKASKYAEKIKKEHPDFKLALGNEIYLCKTRESGQKYYHFILIAKNKLGYKALSKLSSRAWFNIFEDRRMERVVTLYSDLEEIVHEYPGTLIATTACLGGELSTATLNMINAESMFDEETRMKEHAHIVQFVQWCKGLFGEDFYIECAPACSREQIMVNKRLQSIAKCFNVKMVIGSDAHFLNKEQRLIHKSFLNSQGGEREVDAFYEYAYLQTDDEVIEHLSKSYDKDFILSMFDNSMEIYDKIEVYSLMKKQKISKVPVKEYPKSAWWGVNNDWADEMESHPTLKYLFTSDDKVDRYWVNECWNKLKEIDKLNPIYIDRLEEEARVKKLIGEKLETNMFMYPVTLQHYIDMIWDCGSTIGAGRGSSCSGLNHYLLGVTQLDPIEWSLPFWRYLNDERVELGDIDIDVAPSKRPIILKKIKEERRAYLDENLDDLSKQYLGCTLVATFGTLTGKAAVIAACRGYRSEECPEGINVDIAKYLSSLVPIERGKVWSIHDVVYGNPDEDRKPVATFVKEVSQYPGLLDIILFIGGLVASRSSHASGVILFEDDPYDTCAFMRTSTWDIVTQYDLHDVEYRGATKFDFLVTKTQDMIVQTIQFLQEDGIIEKDLSLREVYNKYLHPSVLPIHDKKYWNAIQKGDIIHLFQFDSPVGSQAIRRIKPDSIIELADANGLMRLMASEKGGETPMDKYVRQKNNLNLWYQEMENYGLTREEQKVIEPYFKSSYGVPPSQEQLMRMLMDPKICGFTLGEANAARKVVAKKQTDKVEELHQKVLTQATSPQLGVYIWKFGVGPQMSYSFSIIHALAYSFVGFQTTYLATAFNRIYWNTSCLIIDSASLEETAVDIETKEKAANYGKIAKALGEIISAGTQVSLIDINESSYTFKPDAKNNKVLFGLKALAGVNKEVIDKIIAGRPYKSLADFMNRCPLNKLAMISLIKAGAFDNLEPNNLGYEPRYIAMAYYLMNNCEAKNKLNLQNFNGLLQRGLVPDSLNKQKKVYEFNRFLKSNAKFKEYYMLNDYCKSFYENYFDIEKIELINGIPCIAQKVWDNIYDKCMDDARSWLKDHQSDVLRDYNDLLFNEVWNKYASGTISSWEMQALCFYYHEHELINLDKRKYGIIDFDLLPDTPIVAKWYKKAGKDLPIYELYKIVGTVINKTDTKSTIDLLTTNGVVTVKFTKEYYAQYAKQVSEKQENGSKKKLEDGWFKRGTLLMINGFRRDDQFVAKTYANSNCHQLYKINLINNGRDMELVHERVDANNGEED